MALMQRSDESNTTMARDLASSAGYEGLARDSMQTDAFHDAAEGASTPIKGLADDADWLVSMGPVCMCGQGSGHISGGRLDAGMIQIAHQHFCTPAVPLLHIVPPLSPQPPFAEGIRSRRCLACRPISHADAKTQGSNQAMQRRLALVGGRDAGLGS